MLKNLANEPYAETSPTAPAPLWHPLAHVDAFILSCGWTNAGLGFSPPVAWRDAIRLHHGGAELWNREQAARLCILYHERSALTPRAA